MRVHLTFDVEVWCAGWDRLDASFPSAFERYVWGRSRAGDYALPRNIEILRRHGLVGVFFVEPLFSFRFGRPYLETIVRLIQDGGQDVQLHLHPEWQDELEPPLIEQNRPKRQNLTAYTRAEQTALLKAGRDAVASLAGTAISAFRAGSYAANRQTYEALADVGITSDSSLNASYDLSGGSLGGPQALREPRRICGVDVHPVTVFDDGLGRMRHMQVGACGFAEMKQVLDRAHHLGMPEVVIVSHNFELMHPGSTRPDHIVERRFEALCRYLAAHPERFEVGAFSRAVQPAPGASAGKGASLRASAAATGLRVCQQLLRRVA
jgi:hypothetical protein